MSSPLPYTPYQSHRRGASSISSNASARRPQASAGGQELQSTSADSPTPDPSSAASSSSPSRSVPTQRGFQVSSLRSPPPSPLRGLVRNAPDERPQSQSSSPNNALHAARPPLAVQAGPMAPSTSATNGAPPPLRKVSAMRAPSNTSQNLGAEESISGNGKGKERAGDPAAVNSLAGTHSEDTPPRKESVVTPKAALSNDSIPTLNGHSKRQSLNPSAAASQGSGGRSHYRTASNGTLPPVLPHHMSTAQRLRSSAASTGESSAGTSPTDTPRSRSPAAGLPPGADLSTLYQQNADLSQEGLGRRTAYRAGFQPKGVYRIRTDEFSSARLRFRQMGRSRLNTNLANGDSEKTAPELETQRLERRLEKLVTLHYDSLPLLSEEAAAEKAPTWLPNTIRKARIHAEEEHLLRNEELQIVKWEDDSARKCCAVCSNPFSFAIRKHHCRLCGRLVCASPNLNLPPALPAPPGSHGVRTEEEKRANESKCSGLIVATTPANGGTRKIRDVPRWDEARILDQEGALRYCTIRICKDCRETVMHRQYMLDDGTIPPYLKLYDALVSLQREIEQSLPEFQEMVLGLQKQDASAALGTNEVEVNDPLEPPSAAQSSSSIAAAKAKTRTALALQRDAAQARKQLLANFANYDLIAKKIRNLDDEGNASLARLKVAVATRANIFLQTNMFPLQNLPKLPSARPSKMPAQRTDSPALPRSSQDGGNETAADKRARDMVQSDPAAARETLAVLEQQLAQVRQYAASATKARKFQDAASLQASTHDLEVEIARLKRQGI